ncbi:MAG: dihydropteroate synthase [Betaproteobacteria bacterium]|nr:dihydropteroate synthase [Betaproteobacteria bacterium]NBY34625.1 dihydropteroate synthase [Betaproteobacteria bacterium]NDF05525.1 dihydropteroate synthase [Betaproteobacteria bacterium]
MGLRPHVALWRTTRFDLDVSHPLVMGIVNVTPDSFSDGGLHANSTDAISHAETLVEEGADILDVGGESTRPGAASLSADEEWQRIGPVLKQLVKWHIPVSVDTYHPQTMHRALDLGVDILNDVWAFRQKGALQAVASSRCGLCMMHMHGEPATMQLHPMVGNVMEELSVFFQTQLALIDEVGIDQSRVVLDPGIGFGKSVDQNFEILRKQSQLLHFGQPLMVGWSNKSSLGAVSGLPVDQRLVPSVVAAVLAAERGARILRVHAVAKTVAALSVWKAEAGICDNIDS